MYISARDDSLSWLMHALLYVCSRLKELALLSQSQLIAGIVAHILRSAYIFRKRPSLHSLSVRRGGSRGRVQGVRPPPPPLR